MDVVFMALAVCGCATLIVLGLVQIGAAEFRYTRKSTSEQGSQTADLLEIITIAVDGLRLSWILWRLGSTKNVLREDLEAGAVVAMQRRGIQLTILTNEHYG